MLPTYDEEYLRAKDSPNNSLFPAIAPISLNPSILSRPGVLRCLAVQRLRALLGILRIDYETSLVAWRVHSFNSRARRAAHPDSSAPRSSVGCGRGLRCLWLTTTTSQAARSPCESLAHGPLPAFGDDEQDDARDCVLF
jgi:hypothetical protein